MADDRLTLPEELLLLGWHDERGRNSMTQNPLAVVAGATVIELALREAVTVEGKRLRAVQDRTGDLALDRALTEIRGSGRPRTIKAWVQRWSSRRWLRGAVLTRLAERGIVRRDVRHVLGLFPVTRFPVIDSVRVHELREHVRQILTQPEPVADPRDAALGGLVHLAGWLVVRRLVPSDVRQARQRAKSLSKGQAMTSEVAKAIADVNAAAAAAVGGAAATSGS